ncbi:MAG: CPBP family intramembrane metalloprotease [Planctomycetaceae bacterium]|nr:CPBP family intramembrane metalloprotease [Planctomycetaceae bacterium]
MFAVEEELTAPNIVALSLMIAVILAGLWSWKRLIQNKKLLEDIKESLRYLPEFKKPMKAFVALICFLFWILIPDIYTLIWSQVNEVKLEKFNELPMTVKLWHMDAVFSLRLLFMGLILFGASWKKLIRLADCGFRFDQPLDQIKSGVYSFFLAMPLVLLVMVLTSPLRSQEKTHELIKVMQQDGNLSNNLLIGFSVIILAPLTEELLFRVCLQGAWQERNPSLAIVMTALLFAFIHGLPDAYPLIPLALILGTLYYYKKSYLACVVLHMVFNAFYYCLTLIMHAGESGAAIWPG